MIAIPWFGHYLDRPLSPGVVTIPLPLPFLWGLNAPPRGFNGFYLILNCRLSMGGFFVGWFAPTTTPSVRVVGAPVMLIFIIFAGPGRRYIILFSPSVLVLHHSADTNGCCC